MTIPMPQALPRNEKWSMESSDTVRNFSTWRHLTIVSSRSVFVLRVPALDVSWPTQLAALEAPSSCSHFILDFCVPSTSHFFSLWFSLNSCLFLTSEFTCLASMTTWTSTWPMVITAFFNAKRITCFYTSIYIQRSSSCMPGDFSFASMYKHRYVYHFFVLPFLSIFFDQVHRIYLKVVLCKPVSPEAPDLLALVHDRVALRQRMRELRLETTVCSLHSQKKVISVAFSSSWAYIILIDLLPDDYSGIKFVSGFHNNQ